MKIHEQRQGAVTVLSPKGPLIGDDADQFKARMLEALRETRGRAVLDASGILMVDSRALEALVEVNQELASTGRALKLCDVLDAVDCSYFGPSELAVVDPSGTALTNVNTPEEVKRVETILSGS